MVITVHLLQVLLFKFEHNKYRARGVMGDCITGRFMVFYSLPNSVRVIKERRVKQPGHVARMGQKRNAYGFSG